MSDSEEDEGLAARWTVRSSHSGEQFESGEVQRRRGLNEPAPGVDVTDGREQESSTWSGGRTNYSNESGTTGRKRRLADTPSSKTVTDPRRGHNQRQRLPGDQ